MGNPSFRSASFTFDSLSRCVLLVVAPSLQHRIWLRHWSETAQCTIQLGLTDTSMSLVTSIGNKVLEGGAIRLWYIGANDAAVVFVKHQTLTRGHITGLCSSIDFLRFLFFVYHVVSYSRHSSISAELRLVTISVSVPYLIGVVTAVSSQGR